MKLLGRKKTRMRIGENGVQEGQVEWPFGHLCVKRSRKNQLKVQNQISWMVGTDVKAKRPHFPRGKGKEGGGTPRVGIVGSLEDPECLF